MKGRTVILSSVNKEALANAGDYFLFGFSRAVNLGSTKYNLLYFGAVNGDFSALSRLDKLKSITDMVVPVFRNYGDKERSLEMASHEHKKRAIQLPRLAIPHGDRVWIYDIKDVEGLPHLKGHAMSVVGDDDFYAFYNDSFREVHKKSGERILRVLGG